MEEITGSLKIQGRNVFVTGLLDLCSIIWDGEGSRKEHLCHCAPQSVFKLQTCSFDKRKALIERIVISRTKYQALLGGGVGGQGLFALLAGPLGGGISFWACNRPTPLFFSDPWATTHWQMSSWRFEEGCGVGEWRFLRMKVKFHQLLTSVRTSSYRNSILFFYSETFSVNQLTKKHIFSCS